jgi:Na+-driven multidrug efflux pump
MAYGIVQFSNFGLNMLVYDPLFLIAFKAGVFGAGVATICAEATPMIIVVILFTLKKFDTRSTPSHFCRCFSKDCWEAIKTGLTEFVVHMAYGIPAFVTRKFITTDALSMDCYTECLAAFNAVFRVWPFAQSYAVAVAIAFLPAASFAVGAHRPLRVLQLFGWTSLLAFLWCGLTEALLLSLAEYIAYIFGDSPGLIDASVQMITNAYALQVISGQAQVTLPLLQAKGYVWGAVALSILSQFIAAPVVAVVLFYTDSSHNIFRLMWMYAIGEAFGLVVSCVFSIFPLRALWKEKNAEKEAGSGVELGTAQGYTQGMIEERLVIH